MENLGAEYIFDFQARKPTKFIRLAGYPNNKVWRKKFFFAQGDWEFSLIEIIKDPNVPRETRLPSVVGREEPILNQDEEARISRLREYAQKDPSRMDFGAIFSLIVLATYLRYPQIEGVNDELVRKRKNADPKASRSQSLEAKRSKISSLSKSELTIEVTRRTASEAFQTEADELSMRPNLQLSLSRETAFPWKSIYDKGKGKVSHNFREDPTLVGPLSVVQANKGEKVTILDLLASTRPSGEVTIPLKENRSLVFESLHVVSPPSTSLATIHLEPYALGETLESDHVEVEGMEPSAFEETDGSGIPSLLLEFMADEVTGLPMENWFGGPTFIEGPTTIEPSNGQTLGESIKLVGETINWLSDPLAALSGLIPDKL
jgi:hypothetical protein